MFYFSHIRIYPKNKFEFNYSLSFSFILFIYYMGKPLELKLHD